MRPLPAVRHSFGAWRIGVKVNISRLFDSPALYGDLWMAVGRVAEATTMLLAGRQAGDPPRGLATSVWPPDTPLNIGEH
jgi:hypothetical protein